MDVKSWRIKKNTTREQAFKEMAALYFPGQKKPLSKALDKAVSVALAVYADRDYLLGLGVRTERIAGEQGTAWSAEYQIRQKNRKDF